MTHRNADELRRHIGYVIQGAGLFPHLTVGDNIAIVPRLLKWDKNRISATHRRVASSWSTWIRSSTAAAIPASSLADSSSASG